MDFDSWSAEADAAVAEVERVLSAASPNSPTTHSGRVAAESALMICACVTVGESPNWLIYSSTDGRLMWCRVPDRLEMEDLVRARATAAGHADPVAVLAWLRGKASDPWGGGGGGWGDARVLEVLRTLIAATDGG